MGKRYFADSSYSKVPCGLVAFKNNKQLELLYANEKYYTEFSDNNYDTLNVCAEDKDLTCGLEEKLRDIDRVELNYKYKRGDNICRARMSVCAFEPGVLLGAVWDVTDQYETLEHLQNEQDRYLTVMNCSGSIVFENDIEQDTFTIYIPAEDGNMNKTCIENHMQYLESTAIYPDDLKLVMDIIYNEKEPTLSARMKLPGDEEWTWYRVQRNFKHDKSGKLTRVYGIISNIEEEKRREQEIQERLEIDPILKIYNRNAAVDIIDRYLLGSDNGEGCALFVLDIDDFKKVNDTYGHLYGDAVIAMTAQTLKDIVSDNGIVGRYGGDEFFVFIRDCSDDKILEIADAIIEGTGNINKDDNKFTLSMGISLGSFFKETPTYKLMFECADKALYHVKKNGKAHWSVYKEGEMDANSERAIDYEKDMNKSNYEVLESMDLMKAFLELSSVAKTSDEAVYNILRYVTEKFDFNWLQIMHVNTTEDLITIKYEWCTEKSFRNNSGKSGYYIHSDIMRFYEQFSQNPIFLIKEENTMGFSPKFQREFEKNMRYAVLYNANLTTDDSFYMFVCTRFDKNHLWSEQECNGINEATKMMTMYISQSDRETENERKLRNMVKYDRKTELYSISEFYVQLGRLRKVAVENEEKIIVMHIDFANFLPFNFKFGYEAGDDVLFDYARKLRAAFDAEHFTSTHIDGTDIYYIAVRAAQDDMSFIDNIECLNETFCKEINEKYTDSDIFIRTGVCTLEKGEDGGIAFDKALMAKRAKEDTGKSYTVIFKD